MDQAKKVGTGSTPDVYRGAAKYPGKVQQLNQSHDDISRTGTNSPTGSNVTSVADTFKSLDSMATSDGGTFKSAPSRMHSTDTSYKSADSIFASASEIQLEDVITEDQQEPNRVSGDKNSTAAKESLEKSLPTEADGSAPVQAQPAPYRVFGFCPPGLECLLDAGQLVVHKANLRHNKVFNEEALSRLEVIDETRRLMFYVEQEVPPITEKSFLFKFYNKENQESIQVYSPDSRTCVCHGATWHWLKRCHFQAMVFAPIGQVAGFIRRSHTYFVQEYQILNAQEELVLLLRGGPLDLEIYTPDLESELGRLSVHGWHGIMHEVRRSGQDYGLTFPIDLDLRIKAILLGAVFAIDWLYTTQGGRR